MTCVIGEIRSTIVEHGNVDVDNPANSITSHPEGAYTELEYLLLRLELLTEIQSRSSIRRPNVVTKPVLHDSPALLPSSPKPMKQEVTSYWAKGTGYGHSNYDSWDIESYLAAQREKDIQIEKVIKSMTKFLIGHRWSLHSGQYQVVEESCLVPFFEIHLGNDSLLDIGKHASLYVAILDLLQQIAISPILVIIS